MNFKYTHTTITSRAPGQNVNNKKIKAINKIMEFCKPMRNWYFERSGFKCLLCEAS
jgi:hypothetical protein